MISALLFLASSHAQCTPECINATEAKCQPGNGTDPYATAAKCVACVTNEDCYTNPLMKKDYKLQCISEECVPKECKVPEDCTADMPVCKQLEAVEAEDEAVETEKNAYSLEEKKICQFCVQDADCHRFNNKTEGINSHVCVLGGCKPCDAATIANMTVKYKDDAAVHGDAADAFARCHLLAENATCSLKDFRMCKSGLACRRPEVDTTTATSYGEESTNTATVDPYESGRLLQGDDTYTNTVTDPTTTTEEVATGTNYCMATIPTGATDVGIDFDGCTCQVGEFPESTSSGSNGGGLPIWVIIVIVIAVIVVIVIIIVVVMVANKKQDVGNEKANEPDFHQTSSAGSARGTSRNYPRGMEVNGSQDHGANASSRGNGARRLKNPSQSTTAGHVNTSTRGAPSRTPTTRATPSRGHGAFH